MQRKTASLIQAALGGAIDALEKNAADVGGSTVYGGGSGPGGSAARQAFGGQLSRASSMAKKPFKPSVNPKARAVMNRARSTGNLTAGGTMNPFSG